MAFAQRWMADLLATLPRPLVLFGYQDNVADWHLDTLRAIGANVPDEVGVIGCEDTPVAAAADPPLSSVRTPDHVLA
jgi:DNA-binding LacI/PurR family transcriptional regulator